VDGAPCSEWRCRVIEAAVRGNVNDHGRLARAFGLSARVETWSPTLIDALEQHVFFGERPSRIRATYAVGSVRACSRLTKRLLVARLWSRDAEEREACAFALGEVGASREEGEELLSGVLSCSRPDTVCVGLYVVGKWAADDVQWSKMVAGLCGHSEDRVRLAARHTQKVILGLAH